MSVLPVLAVPAALAYLNARWRLPVDFGILTNHAKGLYHLNKRLQQDRLNLFYLVEEHASNRVVADKIFLKYEDSTYTYKKLYELTLNYAGWLHETYKITKDEVVAIDFMNSPQFLILVLAIWSLGATPALINYNLTGAPFIHSVKSSTARVLIVESTLEATLLGSEVREALSDPGFRQGSLPIDVKVFDDATRSSVENFKPYRAPDKVRSVSDGREVGVLISTSGTTGLPKQAIVAWSRLLGSCVFASGWLGLQPVTSRNPDVFYTPMPLYHSSAFVLGFLVSLYNSTTFVLSRKFSISGIWPEVRKHDVTVIQYVGETIRYITNSPPQADEEKHKVRMVFGNGLRTDVWQKFKTRFGVETIAEFYSATEGVAASFNLSRNSFGEGAIGQTGLICELMIRNWQAIVKVDSDTEAAWRDPTTGFCEKVARGEPGELLFKLDSADVEAKFQGYLGNEKATESKLIRGAFTPGDAWFRTGDVVRWDVDGRIWFSDRIGDTFRWKSENVSTAEVAQVLGSHPQIAEANVYGVQVPKHEGRAGCAALVLESSAYSGNGSTLIVRPEVLKSLAEHAMTSLPRFSVPIFLRIVETMDVTGNNKQQKHQLRLQGIEPNAISRAKSADQIYWLKPGSSTYRLFEKTDFDDIGDGRAKL